MIARPRAGSARLAIAALFGPALFAPAIGAAPPPPPPPRVERWIATSTTAMGITGDISLSPTRLVAAGKTFALAIAADVPDFGTDQGPRAARILKVVRPINPTLRHGNTLCGARPVRWLAVYRGDHGRSLTMAAFDGIAPPGAEASPGVCATFLYTR